MFTKGIKQLGGQLKLCLDTQPGSGNEPWNENTLKRTQVTPLINKQTESAISPAIWKISLGIFFYFRNRRWDIPWVYIRNVDYTILNNMDAPKDLPTQNYW